jgi:nucleoside-diphosphate-sugar epimerase
VVSDEEITARMTGARVLVVGAGWLGRPLAEALASHGARVWTLQRSATAALPSGIIAITGDIRDGANGPWMTELPAQLDHVIVCVAPGRSVGDGYAETYPVAARGAVAVARALGARTMVYTSSTGVYGRTDGGISRETDPIVPRDPRQQALFDAEQHVLTDGATDGATAPPRLARIVLRVAGLYGPGRDPAPRYRAAATTDPAGAEATWTNLAWRDDVISAITHVIMYPFVPGSAHCFNCADGTPMDIAAIARALGARVEAAPSARSHAGRSNQRIVVDALRATGWSPSQPTVLHGLAALGHSIDWPQGEATP